MDDFNALVNSKIYKGITANVCKNHILKEELHCESLLVVIEKKFDLKDIRDLKHFFSKVVWLTWHSNKFRKKYFSDFVDIEDIDDIADDATIEEDGIYTDNLTVYGKRQFGSQRQRCGFNCHLWRARPNNPHNLEESR